MKRSAFSEVHKFKSFLSRVNAQERKLSFLRYRFNWNLYPKLKVVSKFPIHVDIETTNMCNLRCVMCPHGFPTPEFKKTLGKMPYELAKAIIDEGSLKGLYSIKLNWRGEPLLWKNNIFDLIRYAKDKGIIDIIINTNGLLLSEEFSKKLIESGLDQIIISIDGVTEESYETIRRGGDFVRVSRNVINFINLRKHLNRLKPLVRVQMVKMDTNKHEVPEFINKWSPLVDSITFQDYTNRGEDKERLSEDFIQVGRRACPQIWQRIVVTWDGKVVMCCRDWESENVLGTLDYSNGKNLEYFWRGEALNNIRRLHLEKRLEAVTACSKCSYKESFQWGKKQGE